MFESHGPGNRPSLLAPKRRSKRKRSATGEAIMTERHSRALNIWTGEPLTGWKLKQWLRAWAGLPERPRCKEDTWGLTCLSLVKAHKNTIQFKRTDGAIVSLKRRKSLVQITPTKTKRKWVVEVLGITRSAPVQIATPSTELTVGPGSTPSLSC